VKFIIIIIIMLSELSWKIPSKTTKHILQNFLNIVICKTLFCAHTS